MNIANLLVRAGRCFATRPAVARGEHALLDYQHLAARVAALAGALTQRLGLVSGDRVAIVMRNTPAYLEIMFAAWHAGLVVVPINAKLTAREFAYILDNSDARACFVTADLAEQIRPLQGVVALLEWVIEAGSSEYESLLAAAPVVMATRQPTDPAWLFYTSGTTGTPKGAILTHRNLAAMTAAISPTSTRLCPAKCCCTLRRCRMVPGCISCPTWRRAACI